MKIKIYILLTLFAFSGYKLEAADFKDDSFIAGVVLKDAWSPGWGEDYGNNTIEALKNSGSRWVAIHHYWSYSSTVTPVIESSYASETYSSSAQKLAEKKALIKMAKDRGYKVMIIPSLYFGNILGGINAPAESELNDGVHGTHNDTWFNNWFADYSEFLEEASQLAQDTDADMISLGWHLSYTVSKSTRWRSMISDIRSIYGGEITYFADSNGYDNIGVDEVTFWDALDYVGVHLTGGIFQQSGLSDPTLSQIKDTFNVIFSTLDLNGIYQSTGKKTILTTTYTSSEKCFSGDWFEEFDPQPSIAQDNAAQDRLYEALYLALSTANWSAGVLPWGYWWKDTFYNEYPGDASFEKGPSIRNKEAEETTFSYFNISSIDRNIVSNISNTVSLTPQTGIINIVIPPGTFDATTNIDVVLGSHASLATRTASRDVNILDIGLTVIADRIFQTGKEVDIEINYRDSDILNVSAEEELKIGVYNSVLGYWETLESTVYPDLNKITAKTSHFSKFAILEIITPTDTDDVLVYPNPFNPISDLVMTFNNLPDPVYIDIYNIAGELIRSYEELGGSGKIEWDGKNEAGNIVASGIYLAYIESLSDQTIVKIAVVK